MRRLLKKHFGYDEFRPMQEDVVRCVLKKRDSLVLMPTGGGKSICYQIPALMFEGLAVVISPLISLMKDQVDGLKANGIEAEYINSSLGVNEIKGIEEKIRVGKVKILYVAPERLASEDFKIFLATLNISLIAIDEAHCISEWGHDFRREYRNLRFLKTIFPGVPIIALTATATVKVREDILKQLALENPKVFISSFNRKNLNLIVAKKKKTFDKILNLLEKHKGESAIIYCFSRKDSERIAGQLGEHGFEARPYHAGLPSNVRKENQDLFINDKINIIVATIAFGMGIDKPDVRLIIHHTFSKSLEGYYQEIGRAGRDGLPSDCVLFYSWGDKMKHEYFIKDIEDEATKNLAQMKLDLMMKYCENKSCRRKQILEYFGEYFSESDCNGCDVCLKLPEIEERAGIKKISFGKIEELDYEKGLFEKLRNLRREIAEARGVPPFIIFGDVSLREMAFYFPTDEEEFLRISGVGKHKLENFGDQFLKVIKDYVNERHISDEKLSRKKMKNVRPVVRDYSGYGGNPGSRYLETGKMISQKIPIDEIAETMGLTKGTIVNHIERIMREGKKIDVEYLRPPKEKFEKIKAAFETLGFERFAPIYDYFDGVIPYDEIRLVKVFLDLGK